MSELIEIIRSVGYSLGIGYWLIELDTRIVYWPRGLGRPENVPGDTGYHASSLDRVLAMVDAPDQGRFRAFLGELLNADGADRTTELTFRSSWGGRVPVRLAGRKVGTGKETRLVGLIEVVTHQKETERLARGLGHIVEALFISSDSGIVIFDSELKVSRLNRNALDLFGITEKDEADGSYAAAIEERLPSRTRDLLKEAIETSTAVSGTLALGGLGAPRLAWRANPWGTSSGDTSGIVMVFNSKRLPRAAELAEAELRIARPVGAPTIVVPPPLPPPPTVPAGDTHENRHKALEWVKHPVVLVSIETGEIVFANRHARDVYRLPPGKRWFVENLYDVSGFNCDPDPLAIVEGGGHLLRLKLGARVGRMFDYDDRLLFIEYHEDVPHPRPAPQAALHVVR